MEFAKFVCQNYKKDFYKTAFYECTKTYQECNGINNYVNYHDHIERSTLQWKGKTKQNSTKQKRTYKNVGK
jgi:hypothetical protein